MQLLVDGAAVEVDDGSLTLLDVLRDRSGIRSVKDGCSPQGQCGCCTVWVDGRSRVACVTPVRRVAGREITTLDGLPPGTRQRWADALVATGGSQCGFCTPGVVMRLAALAGKAPVSDGTVDQALLAHLCRCTGWQTIKEAARMVIGGDGRVGSGHDRCAGGGRDLAQAARRAELEGGVPQQVGPHVALGRAGFADDTAPEGALVAVPDGRGGHVVGATPSEARNRSGKVQGRSTSLAPRPPVAVPPGAWALTLRTNWVEPAYVEPDASWCEPGGRPASPVGNGGAFGGKLRSPVAEEARALAEEHRRAVRVLWSREDVVRRAPKRPPVAGAVRPDGSGVLRIGIPIGGDLAGEGVRSPEVEKAVAIVAPSLVLEWVPVRGPQVSFDLRGAVWAEAAVLAACAPFATAMAKSGGTGRAEVIPGVVGVPIEVVSPGGGRAVACYTLEGGLRIEVDAGMVLDEVVLRSYCIGAAHQALSWVRSEAIAVDDDGEVGDLTVRSFGVVPARAMPPVEVVTLPGEGHPVNGSDAVFAATAAAVWLADGLGEVWPTGSARHNG